jgi:superfamily II DNA/RNA helicase
LAYVLSTTGGGKSMVFTRTCDSARKLALMLRNLGLPAVALHGHMSQSKRLGAINRFKAGERSLLLATGALHELEHFSSFKGQGMHEHSSSFKGRGMLEHPSSFKGRGMLEHVSSF